jgi:hypothetical protein
MSTPEVSVVHSTPSPRIQAGPSSAGSDKDKRPSSVWRALAGCLCPYASELGGGAQRAHGAASPAHPPDSCGSQRPQCVLIASACNELRSRGAQPLSLAVGPPVPPHPRIRRSHTHSPRHGEVARVGDIVGELVIVDAGLRLVGRREERVLLSVPTHMTRQSRRLGPTAPTVTHHGCGYRCGVMGSAAEEDGKR